MANVTTAPLLLCRICSSWRNIAINTPELWRSLRITPEFRPPPRPGISNNEEKLRALVRRNDRVCRRHLSLAKGWFERAREETTLSLQFWLEMNTSPSDLDTSQLTNSVTLISEILVANAHRLRYLDVGTRQAVYLRRFLTDSSSVTLNNLETLILRLHELCYLSPGVVTVFQSTPKLRRLSIPALMVDWPSLLQWSKLTHLEVTGAIVPRTWMALLRECAGLQTGIFYIAAGVAVSPAGPEHTLSHLSYLRLMFIGKLDGKLFENFRLPALRTLRLRSSGNSQTVGLLFPHLHQVVGSLTTLSVVDFSIQMDDLLDIFRASSNVIDLEYDANDDPTISDEKLFFKQLSYGGSGGLGDIEVLLPRLERLTFSLHVPDLVSAYFGPPEFFLISSFVDMIKSRRHTESITAAASMTTTGSVSSLTHMTFCTRSKYARDAVQRRLSSCCNEGLVATFSNGDSEQWFYNQSGAFGQWV